MGFLAGALAGSGQAGSGWASPDGPPDVAADLEDAEGMSREGTEIYRKGVIIRQ